MNKCEFKYQSYWKLDELIRYCLDDFPPQLKELFIQYDISNDIEVIEDLKQEIKDLENRLNDIRFLCE